MLKGVLFFPVTPFTEDGSVDTAKLSAHARAAEEARAGGLSLMPPYLVTGPPAGLVAHGREAIAGSLPVILCRRGTARFDVPAAVEVARPPRMAGLKDGTGDLDPPARTVTAVRADPATGGRGFQSSDGMPTAEGTKAAVRLRGLDVGGVRPPLTDPAPGHLAEPEEIIARGEAIR
ncbi:hypothetical protein [Streptomyces sp. WELS2]|uniref:hypothetical protein n=1 Tax=Streptomyces sp. WELS2 TaxID=2749435 RepID=UPI0015F119CA|nr:hypothetical protein [Streptomyces sp. WELS2]